MLLYILIFYSLVFLQEVTSQQLQLIISDQYNGVPTVFIPDLAGRKGRIAQDLPNATLAIWGDARDNFLFGERFIDLFGPASFAAFEGKTHYLHFGFYYALTNEFLRFIPLPIGHHCPGQWLQYGNIRAMFVYYHGLYRFGSYCLDNGSVTFLDKSGAIVLHSISEASAAPNEHSPFYQICIGSRPPPINPPTPGVNPNPPIHPNCGNENCIPVNPHPTPIPQQPIGQQNISNPQPTQPVTYNYGCGGKLVLECLQRRGQTYEAPPTDFDLTFTVDSQQNAQQNIPESSFPVPPQTMNQDLSPNSNHGPISNEVLHDNPAVPNYAELPPNSYSDFPPPYDPHYQPISSSRGTNLIRSLLISVISFTIILILH